MLHSKEGWQEEQENNWGKLKITSKIVESNTSISVTT